ncbi:MAG: formimidoylglutamase [Candidatus Limimorpha sp.]
MDISTFLNPVRQTVADSVILRHPKQLGNSINIYKDEDNFPALDEIDVAIVGVEEDRHAVDNEGCKDAADALRLALYPLYNHWPELKIADLGNIKTGFEVNDTYYALNNVVMTLFKYHIVPIIIGGSQDLTIPIYQVYENVGKLVNITSIDPRFDIGNDDQTMDSESFMSNIILHQPNYLFNYTNIGYQKYYVDDDSIQLMKQLLFESYRFGIINNNIELTEPLIRNSDIITIDAAAFKASDMPGIKHSSPNGFSGEEGCIMTRYAGLNPKVSSIGFFNYNPKYDINSMGANNLAEMIWYFLEGFSIRQNDFPTEENRDDFKRYIVQLDNFEEIVFLCHKTTGKWWIDLSIKNLDKEKFERHHFIPCSKLDYDIAMRSEVPDRWWQFYQKVM